MTTSAAQNATVEDWQPKAQQQQSTRAKTGSNPQQMAGLLNTLRALENEKQTLLQNAQACGMDEQTQFDLDLVSKNIATVQGKIEKAQGTR